MKKLISYLSLVLFLCFVFQPGLNAQKLKAGAQDLCFFSSVDETDQPYAIYIPKNFDESKEYPLVIFLHGAISNHRLGLRRVFGEGNIQGPEFMTPGFVPPQTDLEATRFFPELPDVDYIVAAPFARGTAGYQGIPEQDVFDMLADIKSRFKIDENRMYLTGLSMGGGGTLWIGLTHPDLWAAIAPVCPAPPEEANNLAGNALNFPVHLFVGDRDGLMSTAEAWKSKFEDNGVDVEYIVYPGIAHNSWEYSYKDAFIFEWFSQFERDPFPEKVNYTTSSFKYSKAYWVKIDNLTPGVEASIDVVFTGENNINVTTSDIEAFTLNLKGHPLFSAGKKVSVKIDGNEFNVKSPDAVSFSKEKGSWKKGKFTPELFSKQAGAEGPMEEALNSNHVYVYGTQGNPSLEELQERRAEASYAADWSFDRGWIGRAMIFPRVLADTEVRQSDLETSNLVLFGTAETNSIIKKYADRLPVQLKEGQEDYGLVYIYPMNGHYLLINSGLPWWTPPATTEGQQGGISMLSGRSAGLKVFDDFVLFKDTPDNVVSQGYFDNYWEIPSPEKSKLNDSGVVILK